MLLETDLLSDGEASLLAALPVLEQAALSQNTSQPSTAEEHQGPQPAETLPLLHESYNALGARLVHSLHLSPAC